MRNKQAIACLVSFMVLGFTAMSSAQFVITVPDGRISPPESIAAGGFQCFFFWGITGRSYSVELHTPSNVGTFTTFYGGPGDPCPTATVAGYTATEFNDPPLIGPGGGPTFFGRRASFVAGSNAFYGLRVTSASTNEFTYSVSDTSQFSPSWSTNGGFDTFYSFQNTTDATIDGTLTLRNTAGTIIDTAAVSIPAGATASTNTSAGGMNTTRNTAGTASFTHNGPPGSIQTEAAVANFSISPTPYVQIVKFAPMRDASH